MPNQGDIPVYTGEQWISTAPSSLPGVGISPQSINRFEYWGGTTNGGSPILSGFMNCILNNGGSVAPPQPTSTSLLKSTKRATFQAAAGGGGNVCGVFDGSFLLTVWRGNAAGLGGFNLRLRFGFESAGSGALHRMLAGLIAQSGIAGAADWTTQTTIASIGVGFTQTPAPNFTGNWQLIHSVGDGVTAPTVTDLGASVPVNATDLMQLDLTCASNAASVAYTLTNLSKETALHSPRATTPPRPPHPMPNVRDDRDTPLFGPGRRGISR